MTLVFEENRAVLANATPQDYHAGNHSQESCDAFCCILSCRFCRSVGGFACATMNLEFEGTTVPAAHVHAASMAALAFGYAAITTTETHVR